MPRRRPGPARILPLLLGVGLATGSAARASLRLDLDAGTATWRNDGDPAVVGVRGGQARRLGGRPLLAMPLADPQRLRFAPCRALPRPPEHDCAADLLPAGSAALLLVTQLDPALAEAWLAGWATAPPLPPSAEERLASRIEQLAERLAGPLHHRDTAQLLAGLRQARAALPATAGDGPTARLAERTEAMLGVLQEVWRLRNAYASRDLSLPCDTLAGRVDAFNRAAGAAVVELRPLRPPGLCLFCANACTVDTADRLLVEMKSALRSELERDGSGAGGGGIAAPLPLP